MDREPLRVAIEAALAAGEILRSGRGRDKEARAKSHPGDVVTAFDRRAEEAIVRVLRSAFPHDGIEAEEGTTAPSTSQAVWVIDPLDGTLNFVRELPHSAVSIARVRDGRGEVACVHDPWRNELFTALVGEGARLDGAPIQVSDQVDLDGAHVAVGYSSRLESAVLLHARVQRLLALGGRVRTGGSAVLDLAYVACGRLDGAIYLALHAWDVAAGALLVAEAGGRVSDLDGRPSVDPERGVVCTNGRLHGRLVAAIRLDGRET